MICPKCGTDIGSEDGFVVCPGCQSMLYAMDGVVQADNSEEIKTEDYYSEDLNSVESKSKENNSEYKKTEYKSSDDKNSEYKNSDVDTAGALGSSELLFQEAADSLKIESAIESKELLNDIPVSESAADALDIDLNQGSDPSNLSGEILTQNNESHYDFDNPMSSIFDTPPTKEEPNQSASSFNFNENTQENLQVNLNEIAEFGNNENVISSVVYDLFLQEINSAEQRQLIKEALTDSRFKLSPEQSVDRIIKGNLILKNLDPMTTHIIVQRLKDSNIQINWSQHVH